VCRQARIGSIVEARLLNWDDLRFFLAIARQGNLTAAAKQLRVAQSTAGRRLAALEDSLGVRLLQRKPSGYTLTRAGEAVRGQAERVEAEALAVERTVGGRDTKLAGVVRVTCPETFAAHVLAPSLAALQDRHPEIVVELIPNARELSLSMREADIAVRLTRPHQHDLVVTRIGRLGFGLYASAAYLKRHGEPDFKTGCSGHRLLTLLDEHGSSQQARWLGRIASRARSGIQTSSHEALLATARAGGGLACLARFHADPERSLRRLEPPTAAPATDISLVVHKDNRRTPRISVVLTTIVEATRSLSALLNPHR
jgi:DNA-binding transcriptional LysR family regulator